MRKVLVLVAAFLIVIVVATVSANAIQEHSKSTSARKTADTFVSYILKDDGDKSYAMLTANAQSGLDKSKWDLQSANFNGFFYNRQPHLQSVHKQGSGYRVIYAIQGEDGPYDFTVNLVPAGKDWQVKQFTSVQATQNS